MLGRHWKTGAGVDNRCAAGDELTQRPAYREKVRLDVLDLDRGFTQSQMAAMSGCGGGRLPTTRF